MGADTYSEADIDAAIERLSEAESFAEAESIVARAAPGLQRVLATALGAGGWFGESHESEALKAATTPDEERRITAVRTLLAEETRIGMMVGVAVGWALHSELARGAEEAPAEGGGGAAGSGESAGRGGAAGGESEAESDDDGAARAD